MGGGKAKLDFVARPQWCLPVLLRQGVVDHSRGTRPAPLRGGSGANAKKRGDSHIGVPPFCPAELTLHRPGLISLRTHTLIPTPYSGCCRFTMLTGDVGGRRTVFAMSKFRHDFGVCRSVRIPFSRKAVPFPVHVCTR